VVGQVKKMLQGTFLYYRYLVPITLTDLPFEKYLSNIL
jgi:hypothetical protein